MKKQLLIAAVAATMSVSALADVSITGGAKVNYTNTDANSGNSNVFKHDVWLNTVGKSGDTSVLFKVGNEEAGNDSDPGTTVSLKDVYLKSKVGMVNVKMGQWSSSDSLLNDDKRTAGRFSADMSVGGVKVWFADKNKSGEDIGVSGTFSGVTLYHEQGRSSNETRVSTDLAGFKAEYRMVNVDGTTDATTKTSNSVYAGSQKANNSDEQSFQISKAVGGVTLTYAQFKADSLTTTDGFVNTTKISVKDATTGAEVKHDLNGGVHEGSAFGASMAVAGNTIQLRTSKSKQTKGAGDDKANRVVLTRPLAAGTTFEATYTNYKTVDAAAAKKVLDLELAVSF